MPCGCHARLTASMPLQTLPYCNVVWVGWGCIGVSPVRRGHNRHRPGRKVVVKQEKGAEDPTAFGAGGSHHPWADPGSRLRSEEHTSELQSLMRNSYDVLCLKKQNNNTT